MKISRRAFVKSGGILRLRRRSNDQRESEQQKNCEPHSKHSMIHFIPPKRIFEL